MAGKVIIAIGSFVGSLLTLGQSFFALIPIIKAVGIAFVANPIGAVITAIAAGAALIISNWDKVGPFFTALWNGITGIFTSAVSNIEKVISGWVDGIKTLWSGLFNGDMSKIVDGFFKMFDASFNLVPDSFKKIGPDLLAGAQNILGDIGKKFHDFFGAFDLSDMLPESFKDAIGWLKGKLGWGSNDDKKQAPRPAPAPAGGVYGTAPVAGTQKVQGTMNIEVTAKNGASAEIKQTTGTNGLQVFGDVGLADRMDH